VSARPIPAIALAALLISCSDSPPTPAPERDPAADPSYGRTIEQLNSTVRAAREFRRQGKPDDAAALIEKGEPLESQLLAVHHPTLAAMQAASDLDDLYARMLLSNKHYEWARFLFQKNLARWKHWTPASEDTEARLKQAEDAIAECDRGMAK